MLARLFQTFRHARMIARETPRFRGAERIAIGTADVTQNPGWLPTDQGTLDVTRRADFARFWDPGTRRAFLAEHVWEHLTLEQARAGILNCFEFLGRGGRLRIAVPDGYFPDAAYIEYVRPGGSGPGADDHKVLWTKDTLPPLLADAGFEVHLLEYWDETGAFHADEWSSEDGQVLRTKRYDPRNTDGELRYTSLLVDGIKSAG
jgi:predicted SAM-dependent methyltransferase